MAKLCIITGATSGIGLACCIAMRSQGYAVLGVGRNASKAAIAKQSILEKTSGDLPCDFVLGDLSTLAGVESVAHQLRDYVAKNHVSIDVLMHIAGGVFTKRLLNADGFEMTFAINHLAPFYLTHLLMPLLGKDAPTRIQVVSSMSHYHARIRFSDLMLRHGYWIFGAYKQSKLANVLFVHHLATLVDSSRITVNAIDPGLVNTEIAGKGTGWLVSWVWNSRKKHADSPDVPAKHMMNLATSDAYQTMSGYYFRDGLIQKTARIARNPENAKRLWDQSLQLCGIQDYFHPIR